MILPFAACSKEDPGAASEATTETTLPKLSLVGMVDEWEFTGKDYNLTHDHYLDATEIIFDVFMQPIVKEYKWTYSYVAKIGDKVIDQKDNIESGGANNFEISIKSDEPFEEGHLVISIIDEEGNEICKGETDVRQTPPPSIADLYGYTMDKDKENVLPGTNISVKIPEGFEPSESMGDDKVKDQIVGFFADKDGCIFEIMYCGAYNYKSHVVDSAIENAIVMLINYYEGNNVTCSDPKSTKFSIGEDEFNVRYVYTDPISKMEKKSMLMVSFAVGDHDTAYGVVVQIIVPAGEEIDAESRIRKITDLFGEAK